MLDENKVYRGYRIYHNWTIDGGNSNGTAHGYWLRRPPGLSYTHNGTIYYGFKGYIGPQASEAYAWDWVGYTTVSGGAPQAGGEVYADGGWPTMNSYFGGSSVPIQLRVSDNSRVWTNEYATGYSDDWTRGLPNPHYDYSSTYNWYKFRAYEL